MMETRSMYGGIGIPVRAEANERVKVLNAIEISVPFWDDQVQEKIKRYIFDNLDRHGQEKDRFLGLEIRLIRDAKTIVFVYFDDEEPAEQILAKHSRTCAGRRVLVKPAIVSGSNSPTKKKRTRRNKSSKKNVDLVEGLDTLTLDELYPLQTTYYYPPEMYYQQSESSVVTMDSGFESPDYQVVSPPPNFIHQQPVYPQQMPEQPMVPPPPPPGLPVPVETLQPTIVMPETCVFCIIGVPHPDQEQLNSLHDGQFLNTLTPEQYAHFMAIMNPTLDPAQFNLAPVAPPLNPLIDQVPPETPVETAPEQVYYPQQQEMY